jgi:hypothetical protein
MPASRMGRTVWTLRRRILVAAALAGFLVTLSAIGRPAAAGRDIGPIQLFGSRSEGWGFTNTSLRSPGPDMAVQVGDNLILNLTSVDGIPHRWFIDYNNNTVGDSTEPRSPNFAGTNPTDYILYNFTVSNVTGTFLYRSDRGMGAGDDRDLMWGNITITAAGAGGVLDSGVVIAGVIILAVAVLGVLAFFMRRSRSVPPPPPPEG